METPFRSLTILVGPHLSDLFSTELFVPGHLCLAP
jgi:hypothetical protein